MSDIDSGLLSWEDLGWIHKQWLSPSATCLFPSITCVWVLHFVAVIESDSFRQHFSSASFLMSVNLPQASGFKQRFCVHFPILNEYSGCPLSYRSWTPCLLPASWSQAGCGISRAHNWSSVRLPVHEGGCLVLGSGNGLLFACFLYITYFLCGFRARVGQSEPELTVTSWLEIF